MSQGASETILADLELSRSLTIQWTVVGTLGVGVGIGVFSAIYQAVTGSPVSYNLAPAGVGWWTEPLNVLVILVLATAIILPHEWVHGLTIRYYGGTPRYGVGLAHFILPYAYATTEHRFTRQQFFVVLLAPLVVLTTIGVIVMIAFDWGWLVLPLAANAGGSVDDVWMTLTLLGYPDPPTSRTTELASAFSVGRKTDPGSCPSPPSSGTRSSARLSPRSASWY